MIGRSLRHYVIKSRLGQGGMGEVWLARDTTLERDVALKVLPAGDTDTAIRKERFFREAKAASALNHPNIITIYEINADQGIDFIAMEYVQGSTLGATMQRSPLAIDVVKRLALQIAEAVGRAHRAGIVHRDLKPGNIMVTNDGLVKVLDFGLAKMTQPIDASAATDVATQAVLTREGTSVGTLGYMSPEQAIGDSVDARSDVFSFGVILYEMLSGRLPFAGKTLSEMLRELHFTEPPPLVSLRSDVPEAIRDVVAKALAKNPADRFSNLSDVAVALSGGLPADVATAAFPAPSRPGASLVTPSARMAGAAVVVALLAAGAMAWQFIGTRSSPGAAASTATTVDPASTFELTHAAAALLARPDRDGNADRAITALERVLAADPNSAIAYAHLASAYLRKQQTNPDPQWMKLARENAQRSVDLNGDLAAGRSAMGFVHLQAGERAEADASLRRAIDLDPLNALPHVGLALNFVAQSRDADADAAFRKAIAVGPQEWRAHSEYAQFHYQRARYAEALEYWGEARKLTPDNVAVLRSLGAAYFALDRADEAASVLQRALEVRPVSGIYGNLGTIRFYQGRYTEAVAAFEKAVELSANSHLVWGNLGDGYRWAPGRRDDAPAAYRRAIELVDQQIAKTQGNADLVSRRAVYLVKLGDRVAALKGIAGLTDQANLTALVLFRVTMVYELAGERDRALAAAERAVKAGYAVKDLANEPEFIAMRADARYHRLIDGLTTAPATKR